MLSKKSQTKKHRTQKPGKLSKTKDLPYRKSITENIAERRCQLCGAPGQDIHHPLFGAYGADRDLRCALLVCRPCHDACHRDKHGETNKRAEKIGWENWKLDQDQDFVL